MSERKLEEWDAEKRQQENYYKVDTKRNGRYLLVISD